MTPRGARDRAEKERTPGAATNVHTEAAAVLSHLVDGIDAGELVASPSLRERLRGAVMVLRIYAVRPPR